MIPGLAPVRTGKTTALATSSQEFFFSMGLHDPDPTAYSQTAAFLLEGALDTERLVRVVEQCVAAEEAFRTALHDEGGVLYQVVRPLAEVPPFTLEVEDRSPLPPDAWDGEIQRTRDELVMRGWDLSAPRTLWGRLTKLGPDQHALVVVFHHIVIDAATTFTFFRRVFSAYADGSVETPRLHYIDVADAYARWAQSDAGRASAAYWSEQLRGAKPVELRTDVPRTAVDARRSAGRRGIATDAMHPAQYVKVTHDVREGITRLARTHRVSIYAVYAAALFWLLREETGQTDLCIEATNDLRADHRAFADVQGLLVCWTLLRVDLGACATLRDALPIAGRTVVDAKKHGPIDDYYGVVSHALRRVILNYVPTRWLAPEPRPYDQLRIEWRGRGFPRWKRPWDLHLTVLDGEDAVLAWTGNEELFTRATVDRLLERYLALLASAVA